MKIKNPHLISLFTLALILCGCNPLVSTPSTEAGFNPGVNPTPPVNANQTDNASNQFAGGSSIGATYDSANAYLRLDQSGTPTNHSELDPSWTPKWAQLMAYWKLNEPVGSSTVTDSSSGGTNNAGVGSGIALGTPGKLNTGASFPGTTSDLFISAPSSLNINGALTIAAWINPAVLSGYDTLIRSGGAGAPEPYGFFLQSNGLLQLESTPDGGTFTRCVSSIPAVVGEFQHIVVVRTSTTVQFYINGAPAGSCVTTPQASSSPFDVTLGTLFNGVIDELGVWDTDLTAAEVQMIYSRQSAQYAGTFTSRVMDGASASANWTNFSWIPTLPFLKELPDAGLSESPASYSSQSSGLMTGIVGLWHLDEAAGANGTGSVQDSSGNENNGTPSNTTFAVSGKLSTAALFDGSSVIDIPTSPSLNALSASDYTLSFWFNQTAEPTSGYAALIAKNLGDAGHPFYFLVTNGEICRWYDLCTASITSLNRWYHVVYTFERSAPNSASGIETFYVNGMYSGSASTTLPAWVSAQDLTIGATSGLGYPFTGTIDEVAIWSRALQSNEILELYRRGANRVQYQFRSCSDSTCSTNPNWQGPDNSSQTYFSELNNNAIQNDGGDLTTSDSVQAGLPFMDFTQFLNLAVPQGRYFQYRAIMESDDTGTACNYGSGPTWCSPELQSVTVGPAHQL